MECGKGKILFGGLNKNWSIGRNIEVWKMEISSERERALQKPDQNAAFKKVILKMRKTTSNFEI